MFPPSSQVKPVTNQVECHPYFNQSKLLKFMTEHGIVMTAYSPLGSPDRPWATPDEPKLLEDPKLTDIAKAHEKTPAQVVLRWQVRKKTKAFEMHDTVQRILQITNQNLMKSR